MGFDDGGAHRHAHANVAQQLEIVGNEEDVMPASSLKPLHSPASCLQQTPHSPTPVHFVATRGGQTRPINANTRQPAAKFIFFCRSQRFKIRLWSLAAEPPPRRRAYMWTILPLKIGMASAGARSFFVTGQRNPLVVSQRRARS